MDPINRANNKPAAYQPIKMDEVKQLKITPLQKIWNGILDSVGFKGKQRLITIQTDRGELTTTVSQVANKTFPGHVQRHVDAKVKANQAIANLKKLAKVTPDKTWTEHLPAIIKTLKIAAELSLQDSKAQTERSITIAVGNSDLVLHAIDTGSELKIVGLFGKTLGKGGCGETTHLINLLSGTLSDPNQTNGVMKEFLENPNKQKFTEQLQAVFEHEVKINDLLARKLETQPDEVKRFFAPGYPVTDPVTKKTRLLMPYAKGLNLEEYFIQKNPNQQMKKKIANQMILATKYLHKMGIYHLDLKLENFMIDFNDQGEPQVKLIDFGGSQALEILNESRYLGIGWLGTNSKIDSPSFDKYKWIMQPSNKEDFKALPNLNETAIQALPDLMEKIDQQSLAAEIKEFLSTAPVKEGATKMRKDPGFNSDSDKKQNEQIAKSTKGFDLPKDFWDLTFEEK